MMSRQAPANRRSADEPLQSVIAELDEVIGRFIVLRYHGRMTCEQVAQVLDLPLGTVTKIFRAHTRSCGRS